ncbi:hypothetical protein [Roseixanthobacter glucoisosaccharinicivorans]|uniref:hypothetical protein n=1 Tax=Roseixanthobacter glucoisosaccharinicivorans TaxID=3119923 RepID=UPI003729F30E
MSVSGPRFAPAPRARSWRDWALFGAAYAVILALLLGGLSGVRDTADARVAPHAALQSASVR